MKHISIKSVAVVLGDDDKIFDTDKVYEFKEYEMYENKGAEAERTINGSGGALTGEYAYSYADSFTNYDIDVYINDESGVMFEMEKRTDHLLGCRNKAGIDNREFSDMTSEKELISALDTFAKQYIKMDGFEPVINTQVITAKTTKYQWSM